MLNRKILEYRVGSHLYGTNTPTSDEDLCGIILPTDAQIFGFEKLEEIDMSIISKDSDGKNTSEAKDIKYFEIRKFMKLAMENNPNVLEQLFVTPENILHKDGVGAYLLLHKHLFPYKGLHTKFVKYAESQLKKMEIKPKNYSELKDTLAILFEYVGTDSLIDIKNRDHIDNAKVFLVEIKDYLLEKKAPVEFLDSFIKIGDLNIQKNIQIKQAILQIDRRIKQAGNRTELYTKYGFDVKFGMHTIRLLLEGKELLETGNLQFPLKNKDMLLDIRNGNWKVAEVISYSEELIKAVKYSHETSKLLDKPHYNDIQNLCMKILKENL